jgi:acylphosphatase
MNESSEKMANAHAVISGYVQGVGYRWWVMRKAKQYDLKGYVRNLYDGDVEVEVEGNRSMIIDFVKELRIGPTSASITGANIQWGHYQGKYKGFEIKF